jgi:hypothetical protein
MTYHQRETEKDRQAQKAIMEFFAEKWGCNVTETPPINQSGGQKYRIDGWLTLKDDDKRFCFVECKGYTKAGFYGLNVPKYRDGVELAEAANVPFIYAFSEPGRYGYVVVVDSDKKKAPCISRVTGRTPRHRPKNFDDTEPMIMFSEECITFFDQPRESA